MGQQISKESAETLCNNYDTKQENLTKLIGKKDNRSVGFSISEVREYLDYIEKDGENINGVRVYLGSNNETKLTTVFLAPTSNGVDNTSLNAFNMGSNGTPTNKKYGK